MNSSDNLISIRRPLLSSLGAGLCILLISILIGIFWLERHHINEDLLARRDALATSLDFTLKRYAARMGNHMDLVAADPCLVTAIGARNREALFDCAVPYLEKASGFVQISEMAFYTKHLRSLLRIRLSGRLDDASASDILRRSSDTGEMAFGLHLERSGSLSLVVAKPWLLDDELVGFMETAVDFGSIRRQISVPADSRLLVIIDKGFIDRAAWKNRNESIGFDGNWWLLHHFVPLGKENMDFLSRLSGRDKLQSRQNRETPVYSNREGRHQAEVGTPLVDASGRSVGELVLILDIQERMSAMWQLVFVLGVIFVGTAVTLFMLSSLLLRSLEIRLTESYADLRKENAERRATEHTLRKLSSAVEQSGSAVLITDSQGRIEYSNPRFTEMTGFSREEVVGSTPKMLRSDETPVAVYQNLWDTILTGHHWHGEVRNRKKSGELFWSHLSIAPIPDESGKITHFVSVSEDVTDQKDSQERIEQLAFFDPLTGLPNRRLFTDRLEQALQNTVRYGKRIALFFLDLDHFKWVNDSLGHDAGDILLQTLADRLKAVLRKGDTVARLGGDEFTVLLKDIRGTAAAEKVARTLVKALKPPVRIQNQEISLTSSIGISIAPDDGIDPETLMKHADLAMYKAKEIGRDNYRFYTASLNRKTMKRNRIEKEMRAALERDEFTLLYQPIIDLPTGKVAAVEALIRWNHPRRGLVPPAKFMNLAEDTELILPLGEWTLRQACRQIKNMQETNTAKKVCVTVNLSAKQFLDSSLPDKLRQILDETGLSGRLLKLEIRENILTENVSRVIQSLRRLKDLGIALSIDNFGTGYSSVNDLKLFPVDTLKVDKSIISDIPTDGSDGEITTAVIAMAHKLRFDVTAEGVETPEQRDFLARNHCDQAQGYLFSQPLAFDDLKSFLTDYPEQRAIA